MHPHRKTLQLCHQVADQLNYVFSGECHDPMLQELQVLEVQPAPDASQLLVIVAPALPDGQLPALEVQQRLQAATGWLRTEVAAAITRKRAPQLLFQFIGSPPVGAALPLDA